MHIIKFIISIYYLLIISLYYHFTATKSHLPSTLGHAKPFHLKKKNNILCPTILFTDILPVYPDSHAYVTEQRTEQYQDLLYAVEMFELEDLTGPRSKVLLQMWLLENEETRPPIFPETNCCVSEKQYSSFLFMMKFIVCFFKFKIKNWMWCLKVMFSFTYILL